MPTFALLVTSGVGLTSDLWTPVVQRLLALQAQPESPFRIASVWAVDRPTHGDAAVMNADVLERTFGQFCESRLSWFFLLSLFFLFLLPFHHPSLRLPSSALRRFVRPLLLVYTVAVAPRQLPCLLCCPRTSSADFALPCLASPPLLIPTLLMPRLPRIAATADFSSLSPSIHPSILPSDPISVRPTQCPIGPRRPAPPDADLVC
ncbi:hypothetical protein DENSPDRAFT_845602 [Dentipellis sp. KUC8613]|nr:hypothetical protein DENSPDRAFT_845602 [Dentipellis sp. KUC8613]